MGKRSSFFTRGTERDFGVRDDDHVVAASVPLDAKYEGTAKDLSVKLIEIDRIVAKAQVRTDFSDEAIEEMATSLKTLGQQQPILVYWSEDDDRYVILCGERRYRGAKRAGLTSLSCKVYPHKPSEKERVELQWVENAIRRDLNPIESSRALKRLQDHTGMSTTELAKRTGKNQSTISRLLSLLKLPESIQDNVAAGKIPTSIAREIVKKKNEDDQLDMARRYLEGEIDTAAAQAETNSKASSKKGGASKANKRWKIGGVTIGVSYGRGVSLLDVAEALRQKAEEIENDGRTKPKRAAA